MIPIYKPYLPKKSLKYAHKALDSTWISNLGEYKNLSKELLVKIINSPELILTNNGTTSTHLIFKALKIKKPKLKNIIVPCNVYVAAWNSMLFDGNDINLIPTKCNINTWNSDIEDLIREAKLHDPEDTAILIVHNLGGIINVPKIKTIIPEYEIIEDNCEGFLGKYENKYSGTHCLASSVSFYGNKTITCGEGGAIIINDDTISETLEKIHSQGQTKERYIHDILGYNYRMTNVQAAILYGQLLYHKEILGKKKVVFERYKKNLKHKNIVFQHEEDNCDNALWMFSVRILGNKSYKNMLEYFSRIGIETRNMFFPMSYHKHLRKFSKPEKENEAHQLMNEILILPSSPHLKKEEIDFISDNVIKYCSLLEQ